MDEEARLAKLEAKVEFLWDMVVFLNMHPYYKVGDYLNEHAAKLKELTGESRS
jgi:hypothetical protein